MPAKVNRHLRVDPLAQSGLDHPGLATFWDAAVEDARVTLAAGTVVHGSRKAFLAQHPGKLPQLLREVVRSRDPIAFGPEGWSVGRFVLTCCMDQFRKEALA